MKTHLSFFAALLCLVPAASPGTEKPNIHELTMEQLKFYSDIQMQLAPEKGNLERKVRKAFPHRKSVTMDEIMAVEKPDTTQPYIYENNMPTGRTDQNRNGALTKAQAMRMLEIQEARFPKAGNLRVILITKYGDQPWYKQYEVNDVLVNGKDAKKQPVERPPGDPVGKIVEHLRDHPAEFRFTDGFSMPRIRESWRDVLYDEDMSVVGAKNALTDLVGATFSYTRNGKGDTDTWAFKGALIAPWQYHFDTDSFVQRMALAPSVTVNRLDTNGLPAQEVNSVFFRGGLYLDLHMADLPGKTATSAKDPLYLQLRGSVVYATDLDFNARMPGYEVDLEPRFFFRPFPLGYRKVWSEKTPSKEDGGDNSRFDTQLRAWLHVEGGDVQLAGTTWNSVRGSFLRMGPSAQLQARWPKFALGNDLSFTALGSYLSPLEGTGAHRYYYKLTLSYDLLKDTELNRKVSINASYENGGLSLTKENMDQFILGLGILF